MVCLPLRPALQTLSKEDTERVTASLALVKNIWPQRVGDQTHTGVWKKWLVLYRWLQAVNSANPSSLRFGVGSRVACLAGLGDASQGRAPASSRLREGWRGFMSNWLQIGAHTPGCDFCIRSAHHLQ